MCGPLQLLGTGTILTANMDYSSQGWNFCIFRDPGSEPEKIKEPKKLEENEGKWEKKKERGGEGKEGVKQTVFLGGAPKIY